MTYNVFGEMFNLAQSTYPSNLFFYTICPFCEVHIRCESHILTDADEILL